MLHNETEIGDQDKPRIAAYLQSPGEAPKTIQKHVDKLCALGGKLSAASMKPLLQEGKVSRRFWTTVYAHKSEELQQCSLDFTCRKLYLFLRQQPR
jgi:hypothetical protein